MINFSQNRDNINFLNKQKKTETTRKCFIFTRKNCSPDPFPVYNYGIRNIYKKFKNKIVEVFKESCSTTERKHGKQ